MVRVLDTSLEEQENFLALCKELDVKPFISGLFNYKGDIQSNLPIPNYPCEHMDRLDILSNGTVTLCCMDQDGEFSWKMSTSSPSSKSTEGLCGVQVPRDALEWPPQRNSPLRHVQPVLAGPGGATTAQTRQVRRPGGIVFPSPSAHGQEGAPARDRAGTCCCGLIAFY